MMFKRNLALLLLFIFLLIPLTLSPQSPIQSAKAQTNPQSTSESTSDPSTVATLTGSPISFTETTSCVRLNFTTFVVEFYKGTAGYNEIYFRNGTVLVYNDQLVLEYLSNAKTNTWKQRGTPTDISYVKVSDYYYNVTRYYTDYLGTIYNVTYSVKSDSPMKISVSLKSGQTDTYRLSWYASGITIPSYTQKGNMIVFGDQSQSYGWIGFDWNDVYQSFGNITQTGFESVAQGKKADIYFNIGTVNAGQTVMVDPSTVGTTTTVTAISYPSGRKSFYANGRFWVLYSNSSAGTSIAYRTSTDGATWSSATTVSTSTYPYYFAVWFDGTYVHIAYSATFSGHMYYRRGTPNADGTITWSTSNQDLGVNNVECFSVSVDTSGYPWVGYIQQDASLNLYPYVTKSSLNNGTWTTASGFPYQLSTYALSTWDSVSVIPLTSGKMLALFAYGGDYIETKSWSGSAWNSEVKTTSLVGPAGNYFSATAQGDNVHIVFLKYPSHDIVYTKYTYSSNSFGTEATVQSAATATSAPVLSFESASSNYLYCFWAGSPTANHIYYKKYTISTTTWDSSPTDWITESSPALTANDRLTCFYQTYNGKIGLVYMTATASPYNIRFNLLTLTSSITVTSSPATGNTLVDFYSTSHKNNYLILGAVHPSSTSTISCTGQSFTVPSSGKYVLTNCTFFLCRYGSPSGYLAACLYAHSGTYGTSSVPTGSMLANSSAIAMSTITTSTSYANYTFTFSGSQQYQMQPNTHYCIAIYVKNATTIDGTTNFIKVGTDGSSPTHPGNNFRYYNNAWAAFSSTDICFYVYGSGFVAVDGNAIVTPATYTWYQGDSHTIEASSPITVMSGQSQYVYSSWSDSGAQSHSITVPASATTYTANFQLQYYLTVTGGNNPSGQGWYNSGETKTLTNTWIWNTISGQSRTALTNWQLDEVNQNPTRSNTGNLTTSTITMSAYHVVNFVSTTQYYNTLGTAMSGSTVNQTGSQTGDNWYDSGTSATVTATTPYTNGTTNRFLFQKWVWSQGGVSQTDLTNNPSTITMSNYVSVTANWIYDKIVLYDKYIPAARVNVGSTQTISLKYKWQSDNSLLASNWIVQVNGTQRTITNGWTNFTQTFSTVGNRVWQLTWGNGGSNYINSIMPSLIWDGLKVDSCSIDVADSKVYAHMKYAYDNAAVDNGTVSLAGRTATTNSTGWAIFDLSTGSDFSWSQTAYGVQDSAYAITFKSQNQTLPIAKKTRFIQSDAQISSLAWDGVKLTIGFSGSSGAYTLKVSGSLPTYVMGTTFDLSTNYTNYLNLSHDGSRQIVVSYSTWGDFYIRSLSQGWMTDIYWTGQNLTLVLNGTSGTSGTLTIYCGSRRTPVSTSGFSTTPEYSTATKILSGQYQFASPVALSLVWTTPTTGGGEGGSTATYVTFAAAAVNMGSIPQGQTVNALLNVSWIGVNQVTIDKITFTGDGADWLTLAEVLPKTLTKEVGSLTGAGFVTIRLTAPADAKPGDYIVPVRVQAEAVGNSFETSSSLNFSIVQPTVPTGISDYMTYIFAALILIALAYAYLKR